MIGKRTRVAVAALSLSAAGFASWMASEGFSSEPYIPTKGDVPTIGYGSTRYEDGTPVQITDPPITRERAVQLARNLHSEEEARFRASIPGVKLFQAEYDLYLDFVGQFGIGNWRNGTPRRELLAGNYRAACDALLRYKFVSGYDCSTMVGGKPNRICWGVWTRQLQRHAACIAAQEGAE